MAADVIEFYQPVAELKGIGLVLECFGVPRVQGDPLLLAQAIGPRDGTIAVTTQDGDGSVEVAVADRGPGIPDGEKAKVAERFYRGDASRGTPGVGLGLSLVAAVARLHGGRLELSDNHPGLRARLILQHEGSLSPQRAPAVVAARRMPAAAAESWVGALRGLLLRHVAAWR